MVAVDRSTLDTLLRAKWEGMKQALASQDIPRALVFFTDEAKALYNDVFSILLPRLPQLVQEMQEIQLIYSADNRAEYRIRKQEVHGGTTLELTFYIYFAIDERGLWKIHKF